MALAARYLFLISLFALFALFACVGDGEGTPDKSNASAPAPEATAPTAATPGSLSAGKLSGFPAEQVAGCDCTLRLDPTPKGSTEEDLFFVFNWKAGPGVIGLNGQEYVVTRGASLGTGGSKQYASYLHQNADFSIQTSLTEEGEAGDEGSAYSGRVKIKSLATGEEITVNVTGACSC